MEVILNKKVLWLCFRRSTWTPFSLKSSDTCFQFLTGNIRIQIYHILLDRSLVAAAINVLLAFYLGSTQISACTSPHCWQIFVDSLYLTPEMSQPHPGYMSQQPVHFHFELIHHCQVLGGQLVCFLGPQLEVTALATFATQSL